MASGSSSSGGGGSKVVHADAKKAPKAMPKAAKVAMTVKKEEPAVAAAVTDAKEVVAMVANEPTAVTEAKEAATATWPDDSGGDGPNTALAITEEAPNVMPYGHCRSLLGLLHGRQVVHSYHPLMTILVTLGFSS
jgi:hypothetical protein